MISQMQKRVSWQRKLLILLTCVFLGALILSACSSPATSNQANSSATSTSASAPDQTLLSEGDAQLQSFQQWIALMQQYNGDVTAYQQQYTEDQQALSSASTTAAYDKALSTLQNHVKAIEIPAMKQECVFLQQQLSQKVNAWNKNHTYTDSYNGQTYALGYEYDSTTGIGGPLWLKEELSTDQTLADYQQTVEDLNMWLYLFRQMTINAGDKTPYNQVHQTDLTLMKHFGDTTGPVVIVSLQEQALRAYDNGKLINSFLVTTGQPDLPSPAGTWWVEGKKHPTVFKSSAPKGSSDWYPDTPINYAMQYHSNGYFFHDAWWRTEFGPGTNFPHQDPDGDPFAGQGSHGCVNMSTDDAAWLYGFVSLFTNIIIY